jgi:hypothetical protein
MFGNGASSSKKGKSPRRQKYIYSLHKKEHAYGDAINAGLLAIVSKGQIVSHHHKNLSEKMAPLEIFCKC